MNYKIKDLTQAKTLNGGVAIEVQDGDAMSTYATLDQVKAFLGEMQPIVLKITMAVNGSLTPNMTPEEITEAYGMIVADPTRNVPVVVLTTPFDRIYLLPQTYSISLLSVLKRVTATYRKNGYITPYSLVLTETEITFADSEDPIAPSDLARLDDERKYVIPSQIAPLQGRQSGVLTQAGYFSSNVSGLLFEGDRTLEVLFWTGDDVTSRQIVAIQINNAILPRVDILNNQIHVLVSGTFTQVPATANTRYHIVIPRDVGAASATVFVNGTQYTKTVPTQDTAIATYFNLGSSGTSGTNFKGRLVSARLFNYALSAAEAAELWNGSEPDRYMLPPTGAMRNGLVAEYIPAGLLEDKWRDTSGAGFDLPYVPAQTGGKAQFDYQRSPQTPSGDPMHDMYLAADPQLSWNAEKNCWVHCGVEVSVEQNRLDWIYSMSTFSAFCRSGMERCSVVVNYHKAGASPTTLDVAGLCTLCSRLEVVNIGQYVNMSNIEGLFLGCKKLKTVLGYMELNNATREYNSFYECESLESIQLRRINVIPTIDFSYSPNLLPEVFTYAIANAQSNKTATTNFILHPTVYAKIAQATEGDWLSVKQAFEGTELFTYSQA